jgi:hypothetical protein
MNFVEANGAKIPAIGLGTMTLMDAVCVEAVETALCVGYRHIDTAERYRNESEVGENGSLHICGVARLYGVCRGPACVLERLFETLAGIVSRCVVSGEQRARENQL